MSGMGQTVPPSVPPLADGHNLLEIDTVTKRFGGLAAVDRLSLAVREGQIHGIIGPNGSGKTTLINLISGLYGISSGSIRLDGARIDSLKPNERTALGIIRTFQVPKVFRNMTVLENMLVPALSDSQQGRRRSKADIVPQAQELLRFVQLDHMEDHPAKSLSGGQSQLLQIARGFMVQPLRLYLMDEPFAGVNPRIKGVIMESIRQMNREKAITFLIVSHEMPSVRRLCGRVSVIHVGRCIAEGALEEVVNNPEVIEAYIGG
jgi:branched-chain amino acid transport system ATP-binding protein